MNVGTVTPVNLPSLTDTVPVRLIAITCDNVDGVQLLVDRDGQRLLLDSQNIPLEEKGRVVLWNGTVRVMRHGSLVSARVWRDGSGLTALVSRDEATALKSSTH